MNLHPHQKEAIVRIHNLDGKAGLFVAMGSGKTRVALGYALWRKCHRILVVCPLSVTSVWEREAGLVGCPLPVVDLTVAGTIARRKACMSVTGDAVVLINYESYWREPLRSAITRWEPDTVILDEAHRIRHRGSRQARFAHILGAKPGIRVRLALTGTPITNGLQDAWSIYRFVRPEVFERWQDFQNHYLVMGGYKATQVTGYRNEEEARRLIASTSFQWEGDLPSPPDVPIRVRLTKKNQAVYETLRKKAIAEIQAIDGTNHMVVAQIVLTLVLRLQQITSGFTRDVGEEEVEVGTEKARATIDLIEDAIANGNRVVVFCRFLHDIALLKREMPADWTVGVIDGSKSPQHRKATVAGFDAGQFNVLLAQIKAGGLGIDLASAQVAIFYSIGFSLDEFLQAKGRLSGALRQRHPVTFYHMICADTVDEKVYAALSSKATIARNVTDLSYALDLVGGAP